MSDCVVLPLYEEYKARLDVSNFIPLRYMKLETAWQGIDPFAIPNQSID